MRGQWDLTVPNKADGLSLSNVGTTLTRRESEIAQLVSEGLPNKGVADQLGLEVGTVKIHLHNIFRKLGISKRTGLMLSVIADTRATT
jgi:two-component system, NarL family, nitrate/nitrite response regulator NarL